jgi:hypothetical protein
LIKSWKWFEQSINSKWKFVARLNDYRKSSPSFISRSGLYAYNHIIRYFRRILKKYFNSWFWRPFTNNRKCSKRMLRL